MNTKWTLKLENGRPHQSNAPTQRYSATKPLCKTLKFPEKQLRRKNLIKKACHRGCLVRNFGTLFCTIALLRCGLQIFYRTAVTKILITQLTSIWSRSTIETLEKGVEYV